MARQVLTDLDFNNVSKITNLPNGVNAGDAVNVAQLNSAVEGISWKDSVRVASTANVNTSSPGATIDGVTMATGDRVLLKDQSVASTNGIYIWNGSSSAMTRALDCSTSVELEGAVVIVEEGTNAGSAWRQTQVNFVLDAGNVVFTNFISGSPAATETTQGIAEIATQTEVNTGTDDARFVTPLKLANWGGRIRKFTQSIGDGSATSYVITHNLNNQDPIVSVRRNSGSFDVVETEVRMTSVNSVTVVFSSAPSASAFTVSVIG